MDLGLRYTPLVEVNQANNSLVIIDNVRWRNQTTDLCCSFHVL